MTIEDEDKRRGERRRMMNNEQPPANFYLSRGEIGTLIDALGDFESRNAMILRRKRKNPRHVPGEVAGYAMIGAEAKMLRERLTRYAADRGWINLKPQEVKK